MSWYRRWRQPGGIVFFTLVTYGRRKMLTGELARPLLREALEETRRERSFETIAMVLLPEHLHCVWQSCSCSGRLALVDVSEVRRRGGIRERVGTRAARLDKKLAARR